MFAAIKEVQRESERLSFAEAMRRIATGGFPAVATLYASEDQREGATAFAEKRRPVWKGAEVSGAHGHGHGCAADHHRGEYTERQRADLDMVLAFNHRLAAAIDDNIDVTDTVAALDPDPLRYMWVDEGDGQIPAQLAKAAAVLEHAPHLAGQVRKSARPLPAQPQRGPPHHRRPRCDHRWSPGWSGRRTAATGWSAEVNQTVGVVVPGPEDLFRPTAAVTADGVPWLVFGRSGGAVGRVGLPLRRRPVERPGTGQRHRRSVVQPGGRRLRGRRPARVLAGPGGRPVRRLRPAVERPRVGTDGPGE